MHSKTEVKQPRGLILLLLSVFEGRGWAGGGKAGVFIEGE